jgi:hypothetical protein
MASNYRGITLLSTVGKVFVTILERRLSRWCEQKKVIVQEQAGFRPGRTTVNHIFTLAEIIQRRKKEKKSTYCCFLDIKKAYDTVWREGLWEKLSNVGIDGKILNVIKNMYEKVQSCVVINNRPSSWFSIDVGLRQGCVLSPLLFLIFINDLLRELKESGMGVTASGIQVSNLAFADDIALLANTKEDLQAMLQIAERYARKWKFTFNTKKCKVMVFNRVGENPDVFLDGDRLEVVKAYKYLGVWFDTNITWKLHKETILAKAKRRAYTMMGFGVCKILPAATCIKLWGSTGETHPGVCW